MKRIALAGTAAVAAAAIGLPAATAHNAPSRTLKLVEDAGIISVVDTTPDGSTAAGRPTPGDLVVITHKLTTPGGRKAGSLHVVCTVTSPRRTLETSVFQCDATYVLRNGRITASTASLLGRKVTLAITGGTGAYDGARGEIVSRDGQPTVDTIRLR